jgi:hypothetical protein
VLVAPAAALAAFPGDNGRIAFTHLPFNCSTPPCGEHLMTVYPDGTDATEVAFPGAHPAWSPDGTKLAFTDRSKIYVANQDGTGVHTILDWGSSVGGLSWSPDGQKLAAALQTCAEDECRRDIYTLNADGTGVTDFTPDLVGDEDPSWSPDGLKIAYGSIRNADYEVIVVNTDGTGATDVTNNPAVDYDPDWSPDGSAIVFTRNEGNHSDIWTTSPDGSLPQQRLTNSGEFERRYSPAWSPDGALIAFALQYNGIQARDQQYGSYSVITGPSADDYDVAWQAGPGPPPPPPPAGYPRPRGATPFETHFVPAYTACSAPNRTHGAPLAFGSCAPPAQASGELTVGTPDANGQPARARGFLRLRALRGSAALPGDEADVELILRMGDIRSAGDLSDYTGELALRTTVRITDTASSPSPTSATVEDVPISVPVGCEATSDTLQGSDCYLDTTIDSLLGGNAIVESARTIWELGQVQLYDGGPDGDATTEPNTLFEVQGVFVP